MATFDLELAEVHVGCGVVRIPRQGRLKCALRLFGASDIRVGGTKQVVRASIRRRQRGRPFGQAHALFDPSLEERLHG